VGRDDGKEAGEYAGIFYKKKLLTCIHQSTLWLSETPTIPGSIGWNAGCARVATWGEFQDTNTNNTYFIFNTHLDNVSEEARCKSVELIKQYSINVADNKPIILAGDFNSIENSDVYSIITSKKPIHFFDARHISKSVPIGHSWTFHDFSPPGKDIIDYIFVNEKIRINQFWTIDDNINGCYPSDHLPIMTELI
jgi:endonuclease/exonuclease/phosphatase family metal-dependent hydrolase